MKKVIAVCVLICLFFTTGCYSSRKTDDVKLANVAKLKQNEPQIMEHTLPLNTKAKTPTKLPDEQKGLGWDLRNLNLRTFDLQKDEDKLEKVLFDTNTIWPNKLPKNFNPTTQLLNGKDPGLGIRALHKKGITGKGGAHCSTWIATTNRPRGL